ncbi:MAG: ATP-binding protein [Bacteroidales bacterium]|nr:ATP-binding protein [Bacteroidales bacterium]
MYLRKLTFRENEGKKIEWLIDNVHLGKINLIVGQNSSGKTRTLNAIDDMVDMLTGGSFIPKVHGKYRATFIHDEKEVLLEFEYDGGIILNEMLTWDGEKVLERGKDGSGWIIYMGGKESLSLEFAISLNQMACFAKRDKKQHPYLEQIYFWAIDMRRFNFSGDLGKNSYSLKAVFEEDEVNFRNADTSLVPLLYLAMEQFKGYREQLIQDMNEIGYQLEDLGIMQFSDKNSRNKQDRYAVYTTESGLEKQVAQHDMSQGMFRAFSVIARLNRYILKGKTGCVVIDDIGEGIDFSRAKLLVNLLIKKAESSGIQLIMSTNDSFIMNTVNIENWAVLHREGNKISLYNYENSREIFEEFKYTGLNNFDFYASEFFKTGFKDNSE